MTDIATISTTISTPDGDLPALLWTPESGSGPGLVMVQEIFGVSDYIRRRSADLARLGYVVLAPELYWRLPDHDLDENAPDLLERALSVAGRIDWELAVADTVRALEDLRQRDETTGDVGLIGFCFGGGLAFNAAAVAEPALLVSYYGSALPGLLGLADQVTAPSLHHFGLADAYISGADIERIRAAVTARPDTVFETYPGAGHAFDNPAPAFHSAGASAAAWRATTDFLRHRLPVAGS